VLIFANPIAGRGRGVSIAQQIQRELTNTGFHVRTSFDRPDHAAEEMLDGSAEAVISIGGDGTLRKVVDRFLIAGNEMPPVLPIPLGTANLMCKHLGMIWPPREIAAAVVATIAQKKIVRLDAARANGELFLLMAGVGIDAQIVHLLDTLRTGPIDLASYVLPAALTFASFSFPSIRVIVDETIVFPNAPAVAFVGNIREYGTGFPILTQARSDDGLLDICVIPCGDRRVLAEMLLLVSTGEHPLHENVIYLRGKSVRIESTEPVPIQLDGDAAGHTPLKIDIRPACVPFLLPPQS
jgi:diacylglycerol kinase family enzyme